MSLKIQNKIKCSFSVLESTRTDTSRLTRSRNTLNSENVGSMYFRCTSTYKRWKSIITKFEYKRKTHLSRTYVTNCHFCNTPSQTNVPFHHPQSLYRNTKNCPSIIGLVNISTNWSSDHIYSILMRLETT